MSKRILLLIMGMAVPLWAAMSDSAAMAKVKAMWGPLGRIAQARNSTDTYWTKQIGYDSTGCDPGFTVVASGLNTWEAAFAAVPVDAVKGPYSGTLNLHAQAWDNVGIVEMQFRIDGKPLPVIVQEAQQNWNVSFTWNSATIPDGVHHMCVTAKDASGNVGASEAFMFLIDQQAASISTSIDVPKKGPTGFTVPLGK